MSELQAEFTFQNFQILRSKIFYQDGGNYQNGKFDILPAGKYHSHSKLYDLTLHLMVTDDMDQVFIDVIGKATFRFDQEFEEIPGYFTLNAPAIAYPYLRSYISSLTALSGSDTIYLPIMNLVSLREDLEKSFERVDD